MGRAAAPQPLVLVIENESRLASSLVSALAFNGFRTVHAESSAGAVTRVVRHEPDLVLFDLAEEGIDGAGLTSRLRESTAAPIVVVLGSEHQHESGAVLDAGANDYLIRPFTNGDLVARIRVWLRERERARVRSYSKESAARIRIDRDHRALFVEGREVHITPLECKLLLTLARNPGRAISEDQVLVALWGPGSSFRAQYLRSHVRQLRQKIERDPANPRHLLTEAGGGYRLKLS
jgi:two-component system, OmpR family, KDP operon response regulator KdpE